MKTWRVGQNNIHLLHVNPDDQDGLVISAIRPNSPIQVGLTPEQAHLIAAAPDLVEALHNLVALAAPLFSDAPQMEGLKQARSAIAKAEGRTP